MTKRKAVALIISTGLLLALPFGGCLTLPNIDHMSLRRADDPVQAIHALLAPPREHTSQTHD